MSAYLSPIGNEMQADANGAPLSGGQIFTYLAGTTTPAATYTGSDGLTAQSNPIVLNTMGLPDNPIWIGAGVAMKFVVKDVNDVTLRTVDNLLGVNDPSGVTAQDQWVAFSGTPTYLSATSFSVAGDQTTTLQVGRRLRTTNSGGTVYGTISASSFAAGVTTVTVINDSGSLDSGLSTVSYGLLSSTNPSIPRSAAVRTSMGISSRGRLFGMTLANNSSDSTNDIDIGAGECMDSTNTVYISSSTTFTKRLDAAWAVGSGNGGLDTGSIANGTYHVFAIQKVSDGVADFLFSTSATSPTMPSGYTYFRRIGSIVRAGATILGFVQDGDRFMLKTPVLDHQSTNPGSSAVTATLLSIPDAIRVRTVLNVLLVDTGTTDTVYVSDLSSNDLSPSAATAPGVTVRNPSSNNPGMSTVEIYSNTSRQIRYRVGTGGANCTIRLVTLGWVDGRGMQS